MKKLKRENKSYSGYTWITDDGLARVGDSTKEGRVGNAEGSHEGTGGAVQNNMRLSPSTATQRPRGILYQVSCELDVFSFFCLANLSEARFIGELFIDLPVPPPDISLVAPMM